MYKNPQDELISFAPDPWYCRAMTNNMEWQMNLKRVVYSEDKRSASSVVC